MRHYLLAILTALGLLSAASAANAQYRDRRDYYQQRSDRDEYSGESSGRNVAGQFDYYALVLSWSPTHCAQSNDDEMQCNRRDGRRFNFVLHGLWPQYERGYPQDCRTPRRPFVPQPLIDSMLDIMPSTGLIIHEYRKHGVCSGLSAEEYFALSRRLYKSIRIPEDFKNPFEQQSIAPRDLADALLRANPLLKPDNFAIVCASGKLQEVRICFNKDGTLRPCGRNEDQRKLCSAPRIFVPPVRSTAREDDGMSAPAPRRYDAPAQRSNPLPGPRMDRY